MGVFNQSGSVNNETTVISSGAVFKGDFEVQGNIHIDGCVEGNVVTKSNISIGKTGRVKGEIKACKIVISGIFEGKADCDEVEVLQGGVLTGEVKVKSIIIEKGGDFDGVCQKKQKK
jgi:cytoskeletal protein CcmA (bactofilin family)